MTSLRCGFWLFDGFSNMVLASAIEPLRAAGDYSVEAEFSWRLLSLDGADVASSSGICMRCDGRLSDAENLDVLFVVAGYGAREHARKDVVKALQLAARKVPALGGLDSGAWLLASAGLLKGRSATIHWQDMAEFGERHLDVDVKNERYVIDRNRITAGGATTVLDLMLRLIGDAGGGALAFDVSNMFVYDSRRRAPDERGARSLSLASREPQLIRAVTIMRANVERPLGLARIAGEAAMSVRTLTRLFEREFGIGPGRYYQSIRLDVARALVEETSYSASEIAMRTGFASSACLSRAFSAFFGHTLRSSRQKRLGAGGG
ncbi:MAG: GlxA family transcriptional regulator [Rhizobiaceae bacterium]